MALYLDPLRFPNAINIVRFASTVLTPGKAVIGKWERVNEYDVKTGKGTAGATITLKGQPPAKGTITFYAWTPAHFAAWTPILDLLRYDPSKAGTTGTATTHATTPAASPGSTFTATQGGTGSGSGTSSGTIPSPSNTSGKKKDDDDDDTDKKSKDPPALTAAAAIDIFHPFLADIGVAAVLPPEKLGSWEETTEGSGEYKREIEFLEFVKPGANSIAATPTGSVDKPEDGEGSAAGAGEPSASANGKSGQGSAGTEAQGSWGAQ